MSDLLLNIKGDSSGAQAAFSSTADAAERSSERQRLAIKQAQDDDVRRWETAGAAAKKASDDAIAAHEANKYAWEQLGKYVAAAGAAFVAFSVTSLKAYADSERVQLQLERAAGEYAGALDKQARALMQVYAVDDDIIKQSAVLLVQWGGVGAATADVQKAALNLASAYKVDLNTATEMLIRNVESGGTGLAKMGVHFAVTGDKGKDLASAVDAINKKMGGAAFADAQSLTGQTHAASLAFEDLEKSFGGSLAQFIKGSGVLDSLIGKMRDLNGLFTPDADKKAEDKGFVQEQVNYWDAIASGNVKGWKDAEKGIEFTFEEAQAELTKWRAKLNPENFNDSFDVAPNVGGKTNKGMKEAEAAAKTHATAMLEIEKQLEEQRKKDLHDREEMDLHAEELDQKNYASELEASAKSVALDIKTANEREAQMQLSIAKDNELYEKQIKYRDAAASRMLKETNDANARVMEEQAKKWAQMGDQIGAGFVQALQTQLDTLAHGGEFDVAQFMGDILAAAAGIAGTAIGTYLGAPAIGAAVGNLAAMGIQAGFGSMDRHKSDRTPKKFHSGGWVDDIDVPRFHSGTWIASDEQRAILQTGERVLSRAEVQNAGGPHGVDAMAKGRGGPALQVTIHAIDSKSAADSFATDLGRGMRQALRSGRGDLPSLLGVRVR